MSELGVPSVVNGIVVDKFLIDGWPKEFLNCWIGICENEKTAYLVNNKNNKEGEIVLIDISPDNFKSKVVWDDEYRFEHVFVSPEFRNSGLAWTTVVWLRTWMASNKSIEMLMPKEQNSTLIMKMFINRWQHFYENSIS